MSDDVLFKLDKCEGQLRWQALELPLEFAFFCKADGRLVFAPLPVPVSKETFFIHRMYSQGGRTQTRFSVHGVSEEGIQIRTDYAYLTACRTRSGENGAFLELEVSSNLTDLTWPEAEGFKPGKVRLDYYIPELACLGRVQREADFGVITVGAGGMSVDLPDQTKADPETIDSRIRLILDVLSLAEGRFMKWSIRRESSGDQVRAMRFLGRKQSTKPQFGVFSHLNLDPVVSLAVERYTRELCETTGTDLAIEWLLMNPKYSELRYLTGMTALEHLVHVFSQKNPQGGLFPKAIFKKELRPRLSSALQDAHSAMEDPSTFHAQFYITSVRLGDLNRPPLRRNLEAMLHHYSVPLDGIAEFIPAMVGLRNDIVHIGHQPEDSGLDFLNAVLRELVVRTILTLIKWEGQYQSFLNGPEWRHFPPLAEDQDAS